MNKAGFLPSTGVLLSLGLKRYYEPLRLPFQAAVISLPYTHWSVASPPPEGVSSTGQYVFHHMPSLLPRESASATSVIPAPAQRPSPSDHRVGFSNSFTRLLIGSLALRPALSLCGNSRPRVIATPLPRATKAYGQLLGRDFNPLDILLLLRTVASCIQTLARRLTSTHLISPQKQASGSASIS
jgi:hypothetical protein